ncbi:MAG: response regulator [Betaproteobacteria bacterium]|nr:response regulator [Betaproteobacteria bacterium]
MEPAHPAQESLIEIEKAGLRARDLVQQILAFSRRQPLRTEILDLREVVTEALKLLRSTLPAGIELLATLATDTPQVVADRTQIHQVLINLGTNAFHAVRGSAHGRIEISMTGVSVNSDPNGKPIGLGLPSGHYARLSVGDNGHGMDEATREHIFDPFFTTKGVGEGTGLGLAVVSGIAQSHGGKISVYSQPDKGTVFHLYLPAAPQTQTGTGQRILYLDDEEVLVRLYARTLERMGYRVRGYTNSHEALAAFNADPSGFDLMVTDLSMPGISGLEVAKEVLRLRPDLPVVLASGYLTQELRAQALAVGIREVLHKPASVDDLLATIKPLLVVAITVPQAVHPIA